MHLPLLFIGLTPSTGCCWSSGASALHAREWDTLRLLPRKDGIVPQSRVIPRNPAFELQLWASVSYFIKLLALCVLLELKKRFSTEKASYMSCLSSAWLICH